MFLVCSTTLWVGHLSKLVQQEELSDTFGKYGDIVSIDMIHPRGCAFIVMNRRQDAYKSMNSLKNHKMQGRAITISWAAGKGVKSKEWKDYWDIDLGVSYIPWDKLSHDTDLDQLEEGGMFDEDTLPQLIKDKISLKSKKDKDDQNMILTHAGLAQQVQHNSLMGVVDTSQPPPPTGANLMSMVPPFGLDQVPRLMPPPMGMQLGIPMGVPPPQQMLLSTLAASLSNMNNAGGGGSSSGQQIDKSLPPPLPQSAAGGNVNPASQDFLGQLAMAAAAAGFPPIPMPPQMPPMNMPGLTNNISSSSSNNNNINNANDDHMDIEMEDDHSSIHSLSKNEKQLADIFGITMFNHPPPQINQMSQFNDQQQQPPPPPQHHQQSHHNRNSRERSRDRNDFRNDRRSGGSGGGNDRGRDRDRRDFRNDRNDQRGGGGGRWGNDSRDRSDKGIQDRLRDIANISNTNNSRSSAQPPSLLDLPLNDQNCFGSGSNSGIGPSSGGNNFQRSGNNFMDSRRSSDMDDMRGGGNAMRTDSPGIPPPRMRHDDRDMFDMRRGGDGMWY